MDIEIGFLCILSLFCVKFLLGIGKFVKVLFDRRGKGFGKISQKH